MTVNSDAFQLGQQLRVVGVLGKLLKTGKASEVFPLLHELVSADAQVVDVEVVVEVVALEAAGERRSRSDVVLDVTDETNDFREELHVGSADDSHRPELFVGDVDDASADDEVALVAADQRLRFDALLRRQKSVGGERYFRSEPEALRQVEGVG